MDMTKAAIPAFDPESEAVRQRLRELHSPWKMRLYFLQKLPTLLWWGVQIKSADPYRCQVTIPYGWRTQNPFQSIYFAAQSGAAELSTGTLALLAILGRGRISMLITGVEAEYTKKAGSQTTFTCEEGAQIQEAIQRAIDTGQGQEVTVTTTGVQENGEVVSRFRFRWSFRVKS